MEQNVTSTYKTETTTKKAKSPATMGALAIVGFIALIIIGIALAIYSAQFIPTLVSTFNSPSSSNNTGMASTSSGHLEIATSTMGTNGYSLTTTTIPQSTVNSNDILPGVGTMPAGTYPSKTSSGDTAPAKTHAPYGLPDLAVTIISTGYLTGESTDSFVSGTVIPPGARPAVKFSVTDTGTNSTGPWNFLALIPTVSGQSFTSPTESSLNPGDHTVFTLGFNQAAEGPNQTITVVADPNNQIQESSKSNNSASSAVTITQTGN
jgi:hypothetical protein